ncbi:MAG: hypothetical protein ACMUIP_06070 [bacterium]
MRKRAAPFVLSVLILSACTPSCLRKAPIRLVIGTHHVSLRIAEDWIQERKCRHSKPGKEYLNYGYEYTFHHDLARISLADIGPVTPDAYLREIYEARELFRQGQLKKAHAVLWRLYQHSALPRLHHIQKDTESWRFILDGGLHRKLEAEEVESAYQTVIKDVEALDTPKMSRIVEYALPNIRPGVHTEILDQHPTVINGHQGIRLDSWDRISHNQRKSHLFILNQGNLLIIQMVYGNYLEIKPVFDKMVNSLEFYPN